jgi:ABC-type multidrug transport system fused ATPase/permease subunit
MLGTTAMGILKPWPLKFIFDGVLIPQSEPGTAADYALVLTGGPDLLLAVTALSILAIAILSGLFGYGQTYLLSSAGQRVIASIRLQLYRHIQRLSHSFHDERSFGDILARLGSDVRAMQDLLIKVVIDVSAKLLMIVGMIVIMCLMDWQLTLVSLCVLPMLVFATGRLRPEIKGAVKRQRRKKSHITQVMNERISAIKVVQAFAREAHEEERFSRQNRGIARAGIATARLQAHLNRVVQVITAFGTCAVVWFGVSRVQAGLLTPGDLLVFTAYLSGFYRPIRKLASLTNKIIESTVCGERILSILDIDPEIKDSPDAVVAPGFRGEMEFDKVDFAYHQSMPVLKGVSFRLSPGETVVLAGESGSGKSTIASLLLRFYDPTKGSVRIDGIEVDRYTLASLREQISVVPQDTILFSASVRENIAYGKLDASMEEIVAAAKAANAHDFVEALPEGYDTGLGQKGATLSGGQRQRIAIARAIVRDAPIVILDEPMAGLDIENEAKVLEALVHLMSNKTCLLIAHDPWLVPSADRVLTLRDGHVLDITHDQPVAGSSQKDWPSATGSAGVEVLVGSAKSA